jgi:endonuclease YncB( thermonuclease family)
MVRGHDLPIPRPEGRILDMGQTPRRRTRPVRMPPRTLVIIGLAAATILLPLVLGRLREPAPAAAWRVLAIHDGDTVSCLAPDGRSRRIRLVGIDAPEFGQAYGRRSAAALAAKLEGRLVQVEDRGVDQHGRLLGRIDVEGRDINLEMVADGWAWTFGFATAESYLAAEAEARRTRSGLWSDPRPMAPAEWRAQHPRQH